MIFDYTIAGLVSAGLLYYLTYALAAARAALTAIPDHAN
jgi:hypothetical protein